MKRSGNGQATTLLDINGVKVRGHEHGFRPKWWTISVASAKKIMAEIFPGKRPPRPGYFVDMPPYIFNGSEGHWGLANHGGKYEVMFYYKP